MKHMTRSYPPENAMLRPHKESTLEKQEKKRNQPKPQEMAVSGKDDILNKKINERMKRKQKLHELMNKIHDPDIA